MSEFHQPVNYIITTVKSGTGLAASDKVISNQLRGRHTITIYATGVTYIGGADVSSTNGIKLAAGEKMTIPVVGVKGDEVYASGSYVLAEYF